MNWRNNLRDVEPYVAGEQPKMSHLIKLNTNENPYEPGEKVKSGGLDINIFSDLFLFFIKNVKNINNTALN